MEVERVEPLPAYFSGIEDPRIERKKKYPLINVIVITLLLFKSDFATATS